MTTEVLRTMRWDPSSRDIEPLINREWIVTNGLGGYASGTVSGVATRRYHGLLISALPMGRMLMLNHLSEQVRPPDGKAILLSGEERQPEVQVHGASRLLEFRLEMGLPIWRYQIGDLVLEKQVFMQRLQNTVFIVYRLIEGDATVRLKLLPTMHCRHHDAPVSEPLPKSFTLTCTDDRFELFAGENLPVLRFTSYGDRTAFTFERRVLHQMLYRVEQHRGYESVGDLWTPGYFRFDLSKGREAAIVASAEPWNQLLAMSPGEALAAEKERRQRLITTAPEAARDGVGAELVLAADQFIIRPIARAEDHVRIAAAGDEETSVIAGYHWFTDWGRDTMISLEGLTLCTGRHAEAGYILRTFARYVRDGLIPNLFPEGQREGMYHTADATLWFFHALDRYLTATNNRGTLNLILPKLIDIYDHHIKGTRFHIGIDPEDSLLRQGEKGYQLTWMDAKCGDWVVTPRRGKAVEINALWYNAVRLLEGWVRGEQGDQAAEPYAQRAEQIKRSFQARFWNAATGCLFDVVDGENGNDPACRPNQIFAISLPHPVLEKEHWEPVLKVVRQKLLTPVGLRSLSPDDPDFKPTYHGDLKTRDAAYHQGTVWAWLIGPYIDSWLKVHPGDNEGARRELQGLVDHLQEACLGSVSEVFDAESPFTARGCISQAWSVAEFLRTWVLTSK